MTSRNAEKRLFNESRVPNATMLYPPGQENPLKQCIVRHFCQMGPCVHPPNVCPLGASNFSCALSHERRYQSEDCDMLLFLCGEGDIREEIEGHNYRARSSQSLRTLQTSLCFEITPQGLPFKIQGFDSKRTN